MPLSNFFQRYNLVKQFPVFKGLNWMDLQRIARKSYVSHYKKGELIAREGSPGDAFYCLISGRLQAYTLAPANKKDNVEFIHRGMHFGIISVLTGENHSLNFEALNDSLVLKIDKEEFLKLFRSIPQLGVELSQSLSRRIRSKVTNQKLIFESTIISVYSPVQGSGSSTYAINLALNLERETHKKVILLNLDSTQPAKHDVTSDVNEAAPQWKESATNNLRDIVHEHDLILKNIVRGELNIDFINATFDANDGELVEQISAFVSAFVNDYHYIIVDLPNDMDDVVMKTLAQSDKIHLVIMDRKHDLEVAHTVINKLEENMKANFNVDKVHVIIGGVMQQRSLSDEEIRGTLNYAIFAALPHIDRAQLNVATVTKGITVITAHEDSDYARTVKRIARKVGGVMIGIVLGGGAALGLAHIGVIKVLEEEGIPIDIVVGSSMGALIGGFWSAGMTSDELTVIAQEFKQSSAMMVKLWDPPLSVLPIAGMVRGRKIRAWLRSKVGNKSFYDTKIPFKTVAYDLVHREELVIDRGSLVDAICESIAIPGVIPPICRNDRMIIDGGVLNPLPTNVMVQSGIKKIIAVNVLQSPQHVTQGHQAEQRQLKIKESIPFHKAPLTYIGHRIGRTLTGPFKPNIPDIIVRTLQASEYVLAEQSAQHADVMIHPDLVGIQWFELHKVDELIKLGEQAARQQLPAIRALIEDNHA